MQASANRRSLPRRIAQVHKISGIWGKVRGQCSVPICIHSFDFVCKKLGRWGWINLPHPCLSSRQACVMVFYSSVHMYVYLYSYTSTFTSLAIPYKTKELPNVIVDR